MEELMGVMTIIDLVTSFFSFCVSIATYVLTALGLYTIAQRRGIEKPWLAWIPVVNVWTLGCISDQYRYVVKGENKSKRKILLGLQIAMAACVVIFVVLCGSVIFEIAGMAMGNVSEEAIAMAALKSLGGVLLMIIPMMGISIAQTIVYYMALYDVYTSCDPKNNVVFLVLSILFNITMPFFVFFSRKKDFGMPPRRQEPMHYMPQQQWQQPQQGWQEQPNTWQQPRQTGEQNNSGNPENF